MTGAVEYGTFVEVETNWFAQLEEEKAKDKKQQLQGNFCFDIRKKKKKKDLYFESWFHKMVWVEMNFKII